MCIALLSTAHPNYPFILLSNRDEFLNRPTAYADWWDSPNQHVLGGRDLQREERGTWLGITKQGRIAVLTNFREDDDRRLKDKSRGAIVNAYLTSTQESARDFAHRIVHDVGVNDMGGFSLLFGELRASMPGLSILSNRSASADDLTTLATAHGETHGLSNSHFGDTSWPKVLLGEDALKQAIQTNRECGDSQTEHGFVENLFDILSVDTLPQRKLHEDWDVYVRQMRNSILIPPVGGPAVESRPADAIAAAPVGGVEPEKVHVGGGQYGTQKQTVILVDRDGKVKFVERTLYDRDGKRTQGDTSERSFEFEIEGWTREATSVPST